MSRHVATTMSCAALITLAGLIGAQPACAVPLEVYGQLPQVEDVALSPDGSQIAFVRTDGDARIIWMGPLADPRKALPIRVGEEKLRSIGWADDTHVLITVSATTLPAGFCCIRDEMFQLQVIDARTRRAEIVPRLDHLDTGNGEHWLNAIDGDPMVRTLDGHTVLFIRGVYYTSRTYPALFRLDLTTGVQEIIEKGAESTAGWLVGFHGKVIAEEDYYDRQQRWALLARLGGGSTMSEVASGRAGIDLPSVLGFGTEPNTLIVRFPEEDRNVWKLLSLQDGKLGPPMGEHVRLVSSSSDFTKFVVLVEGATHGFAYFIIDLETGHAQLLAPVYSGVRRPLEVRRITYSAQDGRAIPAYLTLPAAREVKKLPLIVLPHGGPAARDSAEFDWWSQALADQGYAVLRPNYRGSSLSEKFLEAGFGQWGRKMQTDLSDGVHYLVKAGIVDPARVCIVGASYGGYAALAGVTLDPGVYRCAVAVAGISDLRRLLKREGWGRTQRYWDRFMGVTGPADPTLDAISPIEHIDAIHVPVLLIHGRDDTVVPYEQSQVLFDAMKRANKDVELVTLKHEDHWLSRSETRLQMLEASVQFLRAHNPPD